MSAFVLIQGKLQRDPEQRTSRAGRPFAMATVRAGQGDDVQWWRVFAFDDEPREELMRLGTGDGVAVSGSLKAELFTPVDGEPRVSLTVMADRLISAKRAKREKAAGDRAAKASARPAARQPTRSAGSDRPFVPDAEIPF